MAKKRSGTKKTKKPPAEASPAVETAPAATPQGETAAAVSSDAVNTGSPMVKDLGPATPAPEPTPAPAAEPLPVATDLRPELERVKRHNERVRQLAEKHRALKAVVDECKAELAAAREDLEEAAVKMELAALDAEEPLLFDGTNAATAEAPKPRMKHRADPKPAAEVIAWRSSPVSELIECGLPKGIGEKLTTAGLKTIGDITDFCGSKQLTDIEGIGAAAAKKIEDAKIAHFNKFPEKWPAVKEIGPKVEREVIPEHNLEWTKGSAEGEIMARSVWEKEDKTPLRFTIYTNVADVWLSGDTDLVAQPMNCGPDGTDLAKAEAQQRENQIVHNANRGIRKPAEATVAEPLKGGGVEGSATVGGAIAAAAEKTDGDNLSDETIDRGARLAITAGKGSRDMFVNLMGLTLAEGHVLVDTLVHLKLLGDHIAPPATDRFVLMTLEEWEAASPVQPAHV